MSDPSSFVYTANQVREIDRIAIEDLGIPGHVLMSRAGQIVFELGCGRYPHARRWLVLCGSGNNAGDGYVVARLALAAGLQVTVAALSDPRRLRGDAARAWQDFQRTGGDVVQFSDGLCAGVDLIVDAMLGTGLMRALEGVYLHAVESVNVAAAPVIAVDIPTGLSGDSGLVHGAAVRADVTVTFVGRKQGLYLAEGPECAGDVIFSDLAIPLAKAAHVAPRFRLFDDTDRAHVLQRRPRAAHKGNFGHVLVVGGNHGTGGAVRLCGEAALRAGAGLVTVATRPDNVAAVTGARPELMCTGISGPRDIDALVRRATVIAIGPGLGQDAWAHGLLERILAVDMPLVIDADALNMLAAQPQRRDDWVLTPHPGEAGRLLGISTGRVQSDRRAAAEELWSRYGGIAVLKGRATIVGAAGEMPYIIDAGNPGMASGGMGDVLTGVIAGLLAQTLPADRLLAVSCAADAHGRAGDDAARDGERGIIAGDLFGHLRRWLNPAH